MSPRQHIAVKNACRLVAKPYLTKIRINTALVCGEGHTIPYSVGRRGRPLMRESGPSVGLRLS